MDEVNREREASASIDHALRTFQIAAPPPMLSEKIMAQVRAQAQPRFRLAWFDYVASAIGASALSAMLFVVQSIPPQVIVNAELESARFASQQWLGFINLFRW